MPKELVRVYLVEGLPTKRPHCYRYTVKGWTSGDLCAMIEFTTLNRWIAALCTRAAELKTRVWITYTADDWFQTQNITDAEMEQR
jgi:hypothetical protein